MFQISNSNIYFCKRNSFEMPLLSKTGGKGVPIIVDTSDDMSTVAASFTCLTRYGFFFLLKSSILQIENSIGSEVQFNLIKNLKGCSLHSMLKRKYCYLKSASFTNILRSYTFIQLIYKQRYSGLITCVASNPSDSKKG